eukprot:gene1087-1177_t
MSKFYQRYISGMKKQDGAPLINTVKSRPIDPTAMTPSQTTRSTPASATTTSSNNAASTAGAHSRRVQIFNSSDAFSPDEKRQLPVFAKPEAAKTFLRQAIGMHYLFEALGDEDLNRIIDCMRPTFAALDEVVIRQGELGDLFFCLETGSATAFVDGKEVMKYGPGGCFGELALIYNSPRAASIIATSACKLWTLDLRTFRYILATTSSSKMVVRCEFLKKCAFLDPLSNEQISKLAGALESVSFEDGDYIVRQGDVADSFFIIEDGSVKCTQIKSTGREVDLITLKAGDYFGEMALMLNDTRHANCIAVGKVKCLTLERQKFALLLGSVQDLLARRMRVRILQSVPLLAKLPEAKLVKLSNVMRVQSFADGAYIIRQGEEGSRFYIINEGEVRCTRVVSPGKEEELIRLTAQEFFGERALITNEARKANVIACGPVECLVLDRSSFQTLLADVKDDIVNVITNRETASAAADSSANGQKEEAADLNPRTNFRFEDLQIMRTVGTGTFGRVKMVQHKPSGQVCALKCMNKLEVVNAHQQRNIMAEKNLLFECSASPFILRLLQTYNHPHQILMLMEFIQGGELWSYIYEKTNTVARCAAGGFEMSAVKFYSANVILKFPYVSNGQKHDKTYTLCGTPEYLAPEIVMSKGYDKGVDYWALGCLIYELYLARTPFQADFTTKIFQNIVAAEKVLSFPRGMDPQHVALIKKLLTVNPAFRLGTLSGGIDDIIRDPFFSTVDWNAISMQQQPSPYSPPIAGGLDTSNFNEYEEEEAIPEYSGTQEFFDGF